MDRGAKWAVVHGVTKESDSCLVTKQQQFDPNRDCIADSKWR